MTQGTLLAPHQEDRACKTWAARIFVEHINGWKRIFQVFLGHSWDLEPEMKLPAGGMHHIRWPRLLFSDI